MALGISLFSSKYKKLWLAEKTSFTTWLDDAIFTIVNMDFGDTIRPCSLFNNNECLWYIMLFIFGITQGLYMLLVVRCAIEP